jgi:hypothetical protein
MMAAIRTPSSVILDCLIALSFDLVTEARRGRPERDHLALLLVASPLVRDLLLFAKDLSIAAKRIVLEGPSLHCDRRAKVKLNRVETKLASLTT